MPGEAADGAAQALQTVLDPHVAAAVIRLFFAVMSVTLVTVLLMMDKK